MSKFNESLNTAVFTSSYVITGRSPIVYVAHHEDGTWEFWGKEVIDESDIVVVSLRDIIEIDSTVLEIAGMSSDFNAVRDSKIAEWRFISKS